MKYIIPFIIITLSIACNSDNNDSFQLSSIALNSVEKNDNYYYNNYGEKVFLEQNKEHSFIVITNSEYDTILEWQRLMGKPFTSYLGRDSEEYKCIIITDSMHYCTTTLYDSPTYKLTENPSENVVFSNEIDIYSKSDKDRELVYQVAEKLNLNVDKRIEYDDKDEVLYILTIYNNDYDLSSLHIANYLYECHIFDGVTPKRYTNIID